MSPISVLIVDNNLTFLRVATRLLEAYDDVLVVGTVRGDEDVLAQAEDLRPDIVLIDISMPNLPGLKIIPRLRAALPKAGIIALTLMSTDGYRQVALEAGADDFIPKAALGADLLPAIRQVVGARQPLEDAASVVGA
jgi:two-component system response regulator DesR